ncbi:hypothetical protein RRG08_064225 [Elysia crispata]|uniref:Uncharacterized protein n=1 Tax=Elysia crispata TaxID=231223 RepID=A0AAE1CXC1_9GAST|nr:hypothetical protein RRG08_064225 [Elysia crispata]
MSQSGSKSGSISLTVDQITEDFPWNTQWSSWKTLARHPCVSPGSDHCWVMLDVISESDPFDKIISGHIDPQRDPLSQGLVIATRCCHWV